MGKTTFTFVDLFAGIGGFRIALQRAGGKCLGFSEIDKQCIETYRKNFMGHNSREWELGDITKIGHLPSKVDVLVGGVPCQSWSVAGKMKGFEDPRGKLWHDAIRLVQINRPKVFIFENVKGLFDPRNKTNLDLIINSLGALDYEIHYQLLNTYDFGLPQNRIRIYLVGVDRKIPKDQKFSFPQPLDLSPKLFQFLDGFQQINVEKQKFSQRDLFGDKIPFSRNRFQKNDEMNDFFVLCDTRNGHTTIHSWDIMETSEREKEICMSILRNRRKKIYGNQDGNPLSLEDLKNIIPSLKKHELDNLVSKKILKLIPNSGYVFVNSKNSAGINDIYRIYLPNSEIFSTLTATGTKDYVATRMITGKTPKEFKNNFIKEIFRKGNYRQISAREACKLQGFGKNFKLHDDEKIAHKQFGNAVSVPVVYNIIRGVIDTGIFEGIRYVHDDQTEEGNYIQGKGLDEKQPYSTP